MITHNLMNIIQFGGYCHTTKLGFRDLGPVIKSVVYLEDAWFVLYDGCVFFFFFFIFLYLIILPSSVDGKVSCAIFCTPFAPMHFPAMHICHANWILNKRLVQPPYMSMSWLLSIMVFCFATCDFPFMFFF